MQFRLPQPRQPFILLAVAAVLGVVAADRWEVSPLWAFGLAALGVLAVLMRPGAVTCGLLCALIFFEIHTFRHYGSEARQLSRLLEDGPRVVRATGIVWSDPEKPATASRTVTARFRVKVESLTLGEVVWPTPLLVNVSWAGPFPAYGDRVSFIGSVANLEPPRNPGQFDFANYQHRQGVYSEIRTRFATDCRIESHGHGNPAQAFAFRTARWIQGQLRLDLEDSPEISNLIASMVLGMRGETPEDMKALFQRTGTMHLFAVSGLNVAMLAAIVLGLLRPFAVRRGVAVFVVVPILIAYALVTGLTPSCVRATIMATLVLLGHVFDRRALPLNSLGAAAFVILAWDTEQLFSPGFQFSFVLVVTIVWLAVKIQRRIEPLGEPDAFLPRELWSWSQRLRMRCVGHFAVIMGVTVSAWVGSLAFTAGYFHLFSPSALIANLLAVPLAFAVLVLGLISVIFAPFWKMGVILCNNANWFCAKFLLYVLKWFALIPGSYVYVETPKLAPAPPCEIEVFDLGDGGAAFLRTGGSDWLIDCGATSDYERIVLPYLRSRGVNHLEGLLLTHGDIRHLGAALTAIRDFRPDTVGDSPLRDRSPTRRGLHSDLVKMQMGKSIYARGDVITVGETARLRVLFPPAGLRRTVADDMALVLQLEVGGKRVLFMSDSGFSTEQWLLENEPDLRSDLVVKGQHAKDFSGTVNFLQRVAPRAVICTGLGFGEAPAKLDPWEKATRELGIEVFRQDRSGAVHVEIRPDSLEARGFVNGQIFRSRAR